MGEMNELEYDVNIQLAENENVETEEKLASILANILSNYFC